MFFFVFSGMESHDFSKKSVGIDAKLNFAYLWTNKIRYFINKIGKNGKEKYFKLFILP